MFKNRYYLPERMTIRSRDNESKVKPLAQAVGFTVHEHALMLPVRKCREALHVVRFWEEGGVSDGQGGFIAGYLRRKNSLEPLDHECYRAYIPESVAESDETVIYGGIIEQHFGMLLAYSLLWLWYVLRHPAERYRIAILLREADVPAYDYHVPILKLAGIDPERLLVVTEPTRFRRIIVPEQNVYLDDDQCYDPEAFNILPQAVIERAPPKKERKIYLSRSRYKRNDTFNESYFEKFFSSRGFTILYPEQLSIEDQIGHIASAREIACTFGTLAHLALFARKHTKLILLSRTSHFNINKAQLVMNIARELDFVSVDVSLNLLPTTHDSYSGYIIGPSLYWQEFVRHEYGINLRIDLFAYLNDAGIRFGDYLKRYLAQIKTRRNFLQDYGYRFDHVFYLSTLYNAFAPAGYPELCQAMAITDQPFFRGRRFILRNYLTRDGAAIKLEEEGGITLLETQAPYLTERCSRWSAVNTRLYFLDDSYRPTAEFVITRDAQGSLSPVFNGCMIYNPAIWLCLFVVQEPAQEPAPAAQPAAHP